MTEKEYREAMDCFEPDPFMKNRIAAAQAEGRDAKRRPVHPLRAGLIAACLCLVLVGTAFAASPTLRNLLAEALGGFGPYAQEQDGTVYTTEDGFEFKVLSAMSDGYTTRAYVQVKDLNREDRLDPDKNKTSRDDPWPEWPCISINMSPSMFMANSAGGSGENNFKNYDAQTQTAVAVVTTWSSLPSERNFSPELVVEGWLTDDVPPVTVPLDLELIPSRTLLTSEDETFGWLGWLQMDGLQVREIQVSPLGINVITEYGKRPAGKFNRVRNTFRACLKDGSEVDAGYVVGHSKYWSHLTQRGYEALIWNFDEPIDLEQVAGIYMDDVYFPVTW